jgi:hypothetical protein
MSWLHTELEFADPIVDLDRILLWLSDDTRCYFSVKEFDYSEETYFAGTAGHALDTGELLTEYDTKAEAQTNYLTTTKDANGFVLTMLPGYQKARFVRIYIDEDYPTSLYELFPCGYRYVSDTPVDGYDMVPISANWAYGQLHGEGLWRRDTINSDEDLYINAYEEKINLTRFTVNGSGRVTIDDNGQLIILDLWVDDTPVEGNTMIPISSDWAYDFDPQNQAQTVQISGGTATVSGPGMITLQAESGVTDQLDKITGLTKGQSVDLVADTGDTITVAKGTYLKLPSNWTLVGPRVATFLCVNSGATCWAKDLMDNRS